MALTDASNPGLGITLWQKQDNGEIKPITFGSRYLTDKIPRKIRREKNPVQPNKGSRKEFAEINAELTQRANRLGGGSRPIQDEEEKEPEVQEELQAEQNTVDTEEDSVIMRGDNLPIVDLSKYHTEGKEAHYIQINHIVGRLTENKKMTEENKESGIQLLRARFENTDFQNGYWSWNDTSTVQHEERRQRHRTGRL